MDRFFHPDQNYYVTGASFRLAVSVCEHVQDEVEQTSGSQLTSNITLEIIIGVNTNKPSGVENSSSLWKEELCSLAHYAE